MVLTSYYPLKPYYFFIISAEAAHRETVRLRVGVTVDRRIGIIQVPVPSIRPTRRRGPQVQVTAKIVIGTGGIAVAGPTKNRR